METKETRRPSQKRPGAVKKRKGTAPAKVRRSAPSAGRPARREVQPKQPRPQRPEPEIVYTPAKPFNKKRLLMQLGIVAAVVLAVFFSLSLFFKVATVTVSNLGSAGVDEVVVSGDGRYSPQTILDASGIREGDSLLSLNKAKISSQIITELPYVKSVRIGIKLPGTVNIEIEELDVVYSVADTSGNWWLMTSGGKLIERTDAATASGYTKVLGVELDGPVAGKQAVAKEAEPAATGEEETTQPVTISNSQRLETALTVLRYLEDNDILGEMTSLDVSDMGDLQMYYGQRFQILLGDSTQLSYKIEMAIAALKQLKDHDQGTLDVSFVVREEVVYTPETN